MTCVIVLGLPRSGTSAVAGCLSSAGVNMGSRLLPPMPGVNERGFFEDLDFVGLHAAMLRANDDPPMLPPEPDANLLRLYGETVERKARHEGVWGVKDPKLCFLLPHLLATLGHDYLVVDVLRSFAESARSMQKMHGGMSLDRAVFTLGKYLYWKEKNLSEVPTGNLTSVRYEKLVRRPGLIMGNVGYLLSLRTAEGVVDPVNMAQVAETFIDPGLDHSASAFRPPLT